MKIFAWVFTLIAIALIIFNATKLDFNSVLKGESLVAVITILAALCGIMIVHIIRISKKIESLNKNRR